MATFPSTSTSTSTSTSPSWSTVSSPNANAAQTFNAVACTSASDCWGVGNRYNTNVWRDVTLIEHWNGTAWTIITSPNAMSEDGFVESSFLDSVTCTSASDCWAAGHYDWHIDEQPLVLHWDGASWTVTKTPNTGAGALLKSVTCVSTSDCWAVGNYDSKYSVVAGPNQTLTEHWNGVVWAIVP